MSSAVKTTKTYTYRSGTGGGNADVSIEYSADLSALSRLEVRQSDRESSLKWSSHENLWMRKVEEKKMEKIMLEIEKYVRCAKEKRKNFQEMLHKKIILKKKWFIGTNETLEKVVKDKICEKKNI